MPDLPNMEPGSVDDQGMTTQPDTIAPQPASTQPVASDEEARKTIIAYLVARSDEFREMWELSLEISNDRRADKRYAKQRAKAKSTSIIDHPDTPQDEKSQRKLKRAKKDAEGFYHTMRNIGQELQAVTGAFDPPGSCGNSPKILDMCMAPGGFLWAALKRNWRATVTAYTLPSKDGSCGYPVLLPASDKVEINYFDITMLAGDMGAENIPEGHADYAKFISKRFKQEREFDIAICDGHLIDSHPREAYRARSEAHRLKSTQLALSLEHLKLGGTMIVLLHKIQEPRTLEILHLFHQFSSIRLFKPTKGHKDRSSFYMVAKNVQADHAEAVHAVEEWKNTWKVATFGTEEEFKANICRDGLWADAILESFGPALIEKSTAVWETHTRGLEKAPFITGATTS